MILSSSTANQPARGIETPPRQGGNGGGTGSTANQPARGIETVVLAWKDFVVTFVPQPINPHEGLKQPARYGRGQEHPCSTANQPARGIETGTILPPSHS